MGGVDLSQKKRFKDAISENPDVPKLNYGRLGWFVQHLKSERVEVVEETVRKWLAGQARPRPKAMTALAKILKVNEFWLSSGNTPEFTERQRSHHNAIAGGVVNAVAGFIQMDGGHPAFPNEDEYDDAVHLYAIIKGAKYNFHILPALGDDEKFFVVPVAARDTIVLGVQRIDTFAVKIVELDWESVQQGGTRKSAGYQVPINGGWREIKSFAQRI